MALTDDEQRRLADALAETKGAARALALLVMGWNDSPEVRGIAIVLVNRACTRANVVPSTLDELTALARPLIAALPEVRAAGTVTQAELDALRVAVAGALLAQLGLAVPSLAPEGGGLSC